MPSPAPPPPSASVPSTVLEHMIAQRDRCPKCSGSLQSPAAVVPVVNWKNEGGGFIEVLCSVDCEDARRAEPYQPMTDDEFAEMLARLRA